MQGARVTVLGLSYKANVGDLRESPSIVMIKDLQERGADVAIHDPYIAEYKGLKRSFSEMLDPAFFEKAEMLSRQEIIHSIAGADAVIIATAHSEYLTLTPEDFEAAGVKVVIDGRNCLNKNDFINSCTEYKGIGR